MKPTHYTTAGGVVVDDDGRILVLERDVDRNGALVHEVRLPKGHIDPGETPEAAAVREVGEESGYWDVRIVADLGTCHSAYTHKGRNYERDERYYLMWLTTGERGAPAPQGREEALFSVSWLAPDEAVRRLTYSSEQEFARRAAVCIVSGTEQGE